MTGRKKRKLRWQRVGVLFMVILALAVFLLYRQNKARQARQQIEINREVIRAMEAKSVTEIEQKLRHIKATYGIGTIDLEQIPNRTYFEDSIFMGDSITQSISLYGLLPPANVVARVGRNTGSALEDVPLLANLSPDRLFIWYGMNDLEVYQRKDAFLSAYRKLLQKIQQVQPETQIILLSILPAQDKAAVKKPSLAKERRDEFNAAIQSLAAEANLSYIDLTALSRPELYEPDGIHVKKEFYGEFFNFLKREFIEQ